MRELFPFPYIMSIKATADENPGLGDPQIPHAHLHFHAMLGAVDTSLPGAGLWRRNVVFGSMNWWSIEDLRAEIRYAHSLQIIRQMQEGMADSSSESTSNNRVKSGYEDRPRAPIERVPDAGSVPVSTFLCEWFLPSTCPRGSTSEERVPVDVVGQGSNLEARNQ